MNVSLDQAVEIHAKVLRRRCHGARGLRQPLPPGTPADEENQLQRLSFPA
jgi:hypothetical protein